MKKFYVTKKQVDKYITKKLIQFGTLDRLEELLVTALANLKKDNEDLKYDAAQIKFFSRVLSTVQSRLVN